MFISSVEIRSPKIPEIIIHTNDEIYNIIKEYFIQDSCTSCSSWSSVHGLIIANTISPTILIKQIQDIPTTIPTNKTIANLKSFIFKNKAGAHEAPNATQPHIILSKSQSYSFPLLLNNIYGPPLK